MSNLCRSFKEPCQCARSRCDWQKFNRAAIPNIWDPPEISNLCGYSSTYRGTPIRDHRGCGGQLYDFPDDGQDFPRKYEKDLSRGIPLQEYLEYVNYGCQQSPWHPKTYRGAPSKNHRVCGGQIVDIQDVCQEFPREFKKLDLIRELPSEEYLEYGNYGSQPSPWDHWEPRRCRGKQLPPLRSYYQHSLPPPERYIEQQLLPPLQRCYEPKRTKYTLRTDMRNGYSLNDSVCRRKQKCHAPICGVPCGVPCGAGRGGGYGAGRRSCRLPCIDPCPSYLCPPRTPPLRSTQFEPICGFPCYSDR